MSNLSNLFISQSFYGIVNLDNSLEPLSSASGDVELQDGIGDNLGLRINATTKEFTVVNNFKVDGNADFNGNVDISGSFTHTGSLDILGDITASGNIKATIGNFDTLNTRVLHVTQESASVIFSSGSNVLGDEETDRQDLIGQVIVSGTLGVEGSSSFTGSLTVSNEISSSTVNGIGNVTIYSASVDNRLDQLEVSSGSQDSQLSNLENFTASQENINSGYNSYTSSTDNRLTNIEATTASLETNKLDVSVYNTDSASFDNRIDQLESDTGSQDSRLDSLEAFTGSQETLNGFYNSFTASNGNTSLNSFTSSYFIDSASFDLRLDEQEAFSSSLQQDFVSTGSFNTYTASQDTINGFYNAFTASNGNTSLNLYTQSADIRLNNLELETSSIDNRFNILEAETASLQVEIDGLSLFTGSYATTGSNVFKAEQTITGSVYGNVTNITIASSTASIDLSQGNFFTVTLPSGDTHLTATNIEPGQTVSLRVQIDGAGRNVTLDESKVKFASGLEYEPSISSSYDLLSFISFDDSAIYGVAQTTFDK